MMRSRGALKPFDAGEGMLVSTWERICPVVIAYGSTLPAIALNSEYDAGSVWPAAIFSV